jgi:hypothetical protein
MLMDLSTMCVQVDDTGPAGHVDRW